MDRKTILIKAKKTIKNLAGEITLSNVIDYLKELGYTVVFFNTQYGDELIKTYHLEEDTQKSDAFTYINKVHLVFVDNKISNSAKLYALLHELGHIELGHLVGNTILYEEKKLLDIEANKFVYEVLFPHKSRITMKIAILCIAVVFGGCIGFIAEYATATLSGNEFIDRSIPGISDTNDNVIITRSGESYHREGCMTIKDKDCIFLPRSEAEKLYDPCGICNP